MDQFIGEDSFYKRNYNVQEQYFIDSATYLQKMTGRSFEECLEFVKKEVAKIEPSQVLILEREKKGVREVKTVTFLDFLNDVNDNDRIMSPTMAVYLNPSEKQSLLGIYIDTNISKRKKTKKEKFAAKIAGDKELEAFKDNQQTSFKIKNNALSGAHVSPYTVLYNKSAHSSLTSTCRSATSYGNANNEKLLCGNRHYWSPDIVTSNIISIINLTDLDEINKIIKKYKIAIPTVEQVLECIHYSTDLYWSNKKAFERIEQLVKSLTDVERTAFIYVGDLYHLAKYNDSLVRNFLDKLSEPAKEPIDNPDDVISKMDDDLAALVKYVCIDEVKMRSLDDVKKESPTEYGIIAATAKQILDTLSEYKDLIQSLLVTRNVPASVAAVPSSIRRCAIASDTDSTIFTVQNWVEWYSGKIDFTKKSCAIRDAMSFLASKSIVHILAMMSTEMGVVKESRGRLMMKNEFTFPIFGLTSRSKHYFANISAQEGNVFEEMDLELKGVALRNSNSPIHIREKVKEFVIMITSTIIAGNKLNANKILGEISAIENDILKSIKKGSTDYFRTGQVRSKDSYKTPESSPYAHYELWEEVFAEKYGHTEPPSYSSIKVSVDCSNPTQFKKWIAEMPDQAIAMKFKDWMDARSKNSITTIILPQSIVKQSGIPEEIISGVDMRKIISDVMEPFYIVLESLGLFIKNDANSKLVHDYY